MSDDEKPTGNIVDLNAERRKRSASTTPHLSNAPALPDDDYLHLDTVFKPAQDLICYDENGIPIYADETEKPPLTLTDIFPASELDPQSDIYARFIDYAARINLKGHEPEKS